MFSPTDNIEHATQSNVIRSETGDGGAHLVCATLNKFVLLQDLDWQKMQALAYEFADSLDKALIAIFLRPAKETCLAKQRSADRYIQQSLDAPLALLARTASVKKSGRLNFLIAYCRTPALELAAKQCGLSSSTETRLPSGWEVLGYDAATQTAVAHQMITSSVRTMGWAREKSGLELLASERVLEIAREASNTHQFLDAVCSPIMNWMADPVVKQRKGYTTFNTPHARRPLALAWFCAWLTQRGILLFPTSAIVRGNELLPTKFHDLLSLFMRNEAATEEREKFQEKVLSLLAQKEAKRNRARVALDVADLLCPGTARGITSAECIGRLKSYSSGTVAAEDHIFGVVWRLEVARLKTEGIDRNKLKLLDHLAMHAKQRARDLEEVLWPWIDQKESVAHTKIKYSRQDFCAGSNLRQHVAELRRIFPLISGKSPSALNTSINIWLLFLTSLPDEDVPPSLLNIRPRLLDSVRDDVKNTLRHFLESHGISTNTQGLLFAGIRRAWKLLAREAGTDVICPISDQFAGLHKGKHRTSPQGHTGRRAIDMEILELLIAENRANDFAYSRHRGEETQGRNFDNRLVVDPLTGEPTSIWWPGIAVLMDILLQIPLRHKQGRYLDSGEGDELTLDIQSLSLSPNGLPTATRGRNEAFVQRVSLSPLRDEPGLGMYINTNKTGKEYDFPWLLPDIAANAHMVVEWQKRYNPISAPVGDRKDTKVERAANAEAKLVYPMFRDPLNADHAPVSERRVMDYFRGLLRVVQDKYNLAKRTSVSFFRPNDEPVYDIHALRVTGVTRLLQMGVDVRVIRLLVGHSSLAMTWYYEDISNQRICSAMEKALERVRPSRERLLALSRDERELFLEQLFSRSEKPAHTFNLLRGMIEDKSPFIDVRIDGICPGMQCSDAGVWRTRACSLCKYNITGAAFLAGLVLVLNDLMAELILHQKQLEDLRDAFYERRASGSPTRPIEADITKKEELVDNLLRQWEAQFQYVKVAEAQLSKIIPEVSHQLDDSGERSALALVSPSPLRLALSIQESHHLSLFTRLIEGSKNVQGFMPAIGVRENRDQMLLEIARHEKSTDFFYSLSPSVRRSALDQFATILLEEELSPERIQALIDGDMALSSLERPFHWLENLARGNGPLKASLESGHERIDVRKTAESPSS